MRIGDNKQYEADLRAAFALIRKRMSLSDKGVSILIDLVEELKNLSKEQGKRIDYLENLSQKKHLKRG